MTLFDDNTQIEHLTTATNVHVQVAIVVFSIKVNACKINFM